MSREQRRREVRQQSQSRSSGAPPSRRTPVKAPSAGGGPPWVPLAIIGGVAVIVLLIVYLVIQARGEKTGDFEQNQEREANSSADISGTWVPSQGRGHFPGQYDRNKTPTPFCDGVLHSGSALPASTGGTPESTGTAGAATAAAPTGTPSVATTPTAGATTGGTPGASPTVPTDCYNSNPPTSGRHLNVQRPAEVFDGVFVNIPADPNVYPPDVVMPRESIPHILEHAGIFIGYNCADGDSACADVVTQLEDITNDRIDNHGDRVVMARDPDLPSGYIGTAAWVRYLLFPYQEFNRDTVIDFISDNSCYIDWENFCR